MKELDIKYTDIQTLVLEYRSKLGSVIYELENLSDNITAFTEDTDMTGQAADNIKDYFREVHQTLISGIITAAQALLLESAAYMSGYDKIDGSEDFTYKENAAGQLRKEFQLQEKQADECHDVVKNTLEDISDIVELDEPNIRAIESNIGDGIKAIEALSEMVTAHEETTAKNLDIIMDEMADPLLNMIESALSNSADITDYDGALPFEQSDMAMLYEGFDHVPDRMTEISGIAEKIFEREDERLAKLRKEEGTRETVVAAITILVGAGVCIASAGTATPIVIAA